jgi:prefoldin subunit 5
MSEVGAVVAIGDSVENVIEKLKDYCSQIKGNDLTFKTDKIDSAIESLKNLKKIGIDF